MPASSYRNFRDPVGLAWRMVSDGRSIGRQAIAREFLSMVAAPLDWLLQGAERRTAAADEHSQLPLLLVVGPPRSGTTLVAQLLTDYLDVSYFSNLNGLFTRSPLSAQRLLQRVQPALNREYRSLFGVTAGLHGANDGFHIWNRFLGGDRYRPATDLNTSERERLREFFDRWLTITGKPLLNKNNRNLACADLLADVLPNAFFICVTRDPVHVAQSLMKARHWVQGDARYGWGLFAENASDSSESAIVDAVCNQLEQNMRCAAAMCAHIPEQRWLDVRYESFCDDPGAVVREILARTPNVVLRPGRALDVVRPMAASDRLTLSAESQAMIRERFNMPSPTHGLTRRTSRRDQQTAAF